MALLWPSSLEPQVAALAEEEVEKPREMFPSEAPPTPSWAPVAGTQMRPSWHPARGSHSGLFRPSLREIHVAPITGLPLGREGCLMLRSLSLP